jgi:hypothetical protein
VEAENPIPFDCVVRWIEPGRGMGVSFIMLGEENRNEVTSFRPRSSSLRSAGYQKPQSSSPSMLEAVTPGIS